MTAKITQTIVTAARNLMKHDGKSRREAARVLGVSRSGLSQAFARKKIKKETRGRPRKLNKADMAKIRKLRETLKRQGRDPVASFIMRKLGLGRATRGRKKVRSKRTVQRALGVDGDKYLHRKKKATLSKDDMKVRKAWGIEVANTDWTEVDVWVDCHKCSMPLKTTPLRSGMSWRKPNQGSEPWAVKGHPKFIAPGSKLFGGFGGGKLIFLKSYEKFNKSSCVHMFRTRVVPALRRKYGDRRFLVMCDGDGAFRSKLFEQYCEEAGIDLVDFAPYSGDIAPMENVWAEGDSRLVHKVGASEKWRHGAAVTKKNLQDWDKLVHATFRQIRPSFYVNAVNGMNARIANMVQRKGARVPK